MPGPRMAAYHPALGESRGRYAYTGPLAGESRAWRYQVATRAAFKPLHDLGLPGVGGSPLAAQYASISAISGSHAYVGR